MKTLLPLVVLASMLLTACATNQSCKDSADYRDAAAITPIQPAEGLNLPTSASALKVPELTPAALTAARSEPLPKKGRGTACLDYPPEIAPVEAAPSAAKS